MSTSVSSPAHRYTSEYDSLNYESNFTADISNKMRVPSKILVTGEGKNNAVDLLATKVCAEAEMWEKVPMSVPDRIVIAGHEEHVGLKAPPRELRLEQATTRQPVMIRVETPPRVLTLDEHHFPTVDDDDDDDDDNNVDEKRNNQNPKRRNPSESGDEIKSLSINPETPPGGYPDASSMSPMELEALTLRRHLSKLNRRVILLEQESQLRQQREIIVLSFGITYFVLKVLRWLHHHW